MIVQFPRRPQNLPQGWEAAEFQEIVTACSGAVADGAASGWDVGVTECGEPQVYLLGPPPAHECILCISRVGRSYVIEDGRGQVLHEHDGAALLAQQALSALRRRKAAVLAQVAAAWHSFREAFDQKTEAIAAESMEVLTHIAPQLAALA